MDGLEKKLDREVGEYLGRLEGMDEVRALLGGEVSREDYVRFLKTFYVIEHISRRAVLRAAGETEETNPYLSRRFMVCARGEEGHAEIALEDLARMGEDGVDVSRIPLAGRYDRLLMREARRFPLAILGHSYLFENSSGIMFPRYEKLPYPSKFIEVHAREDPGHSLAIKRTVRTIGPELTAEQEDRVVGFARESGELFVKLFRSLDG